jgi:hypothetical protein
VKVKAITQGFYGGKRFRAGDVFEVSDKAKSSWFDPVTDAKPAPAKATKAKKDEPVTLSELNKEIPVQDREVI